MILLWTAVRPCKSAAQASGPAEQNPASASQASPQANPSQANPQEIPAPSQVPSVGAIAVYEGKLVRSIQISGLSPADRDHLLQSLPQKAGEPLERAQVRDSIRALYATGRFADIQADVVPSGDGVVLTFANSANFFVEAVDLEGGPTRPTRNQIVNASKFQLEERYTRDKLDRALENIRQLMQEGGYYKARVTAESTSNE